MIEEQLLNKDEYKVNLEIFEGPLDLLLYLIKKNDLEIADIPISMITEEYLKYLDAMEEMNVNVAGEYLLMAAELMQIKSKMLLPSGGEGEDELLEDDPRADLLRRLLDYKRYKEAAQEIIGRPLLNRDVFVPLNPERLPARHEILQDENVFKLFEAFQDLLKKLPADQVQEVTIDRISVNDRIFELMDKVKKGQSVSIESLMSENYDKYDLVITFLALLEMMKLMIIKVFQAGQFQTLYIMGILENVEHEEALKLVSEEETSF